MGVFVRLDLVVFGTDDASASVTDGSLRLEHGRRCRSPSFPPGTLDLWSGNRFDLLPVLPPLYAFSASGSPNLRAGAAPSPPCGDTCACTLGLCAQSGSSSPYSTWLAVVLQFYK